MVKGKGQKQKGKSFIFNHTWLKEGDSHTNGCLMGTSEKKDKGQLHRRGNSEACINILSERGEWNVC